MASTVRLALLQADTSSHESYEERVARVTALAEEVAGSVDMIVLSELWSTGAFDLKAGRQHMQSLDGPLITQLTEIAHAKNTWVHAGSFPELTEGERCFNTSVLISSDGDIAALYRKIHVFGYGGESELMTAGQDLVVVDTPLGPTGLATCYDLRFPEQFRRLTEEGAEAFLIASGWPSARINAWNVLVQARAIENQAWLVACNQVGVQGDVRLGGHSAVVDPIGDVVAKANDSETVLYADIAPEAARVWRSEFPALSDRVSL